MAPRPKNPPPDRRQEILDAALRVFARRGYSAATNAEIAREAGVTAGALYYYFTSREDLIRAAVAERQTYVAPLLQATLAQVWDLPPAEALPRILQQVGAAVSDEPTRAILRVILADGPRHPELAQIWSQAFLGALAPPFVGYVQRQIELGRFPPMDPRALAILLNGPIIAGTILRDLLRVPLFQDLSSEDLIRQLLPVLLRGLQPTAPNTPGEGG